MIAVGGEPPTRSERFPPTRTEALSRLQDFLPRAGRAYAAGRNADNGPDDRQAFSNLSPYLRYRLITEREVVAAVLEHHGPRAAEKFVQEVFWRTYWKGWLEARPEVWQRFQADRDAARESLASGALETLAQAEAGATNIEGFDDWARELVETGYMHNHARMWFASIWIFTLGLPWTLGADFFLRHLIDADPASNTLSWRWVAGLQTKGKTYLATSSNVARYTAGRFEPRGLARKAEALVEAPLPKPRPLQALPSSRDKSPALLLVTPEDLASELYLLDNPIAAVLGVRGVVGWPWGKQARGFVDGAIEDGARRAGAAFDCAFTLVEHLDPTVIVDAARQVGAKEVVAAFAPTGPVADALTRAEPALANAGLLLVRVRRSWDDRFWPHATRGFFDLRKQIHQGLAKDGLPA